MSGKLLRQLEIPHIDDEQAKELERFRSPLLAMIESSLCESDALAQARVSSLPKLMSGEIDVSHIDLWANAGTYGNEVSSKVLS